MLTSLPLPFPYLPLPCGLSTRARRMCRVGCKSLWHAVVAQTNIKCSGQMRLPLTEYRWVHCFTCLPLLPVPAACLTCLLPLLAPSACPNCSCVCVRGFSTNSRVARARTSRDICMQLAHSISLSLSPSIFPFSLSLPLPISTSLSPFKWHFNLP